MKKIWMLLVVFCLNSCYMFKIDENLQALYGHPIETAFSVLGLPDSSLNIRNMIVYIWARSESYSYSVPQTADTYGHIGGTTPFNFTTSYNTTKSGVSFCKIKIATNQRGMIIYTEYSGWLACDPYAERLNRAFGR